MLSPFHSALPEAECQFKESALRVSAVEIDNKTSVADEVDHHCDPCSHVANEGREHGDSSKGTNWSHHRLQFGRSSQLNDKANSWLHDIASLPTVSDI
jgi:hypothetical protein